MQNVLVTGGLGFIGSNFIRLLLTKKSGYRVINLDAVTYAGNPANLHDLESDPAYHFVHGEIGNRALVDALLAAEQPEFIVNFAAESHVDRSITGPAAFIETNIVGTFTLLEAFRRHNEAGNRGRFLQVSTDEVYGSLEAEGYFIETTPYSPNSPYAASKAAADHLVRAYHHTYGLDTLITNCSNNYGPYQFPEKLIPLMIGNALEGRALPVYGDGKNVRDWLYVEDHCRALELVMRTARSGETYNIGGHNEMANLDLVRLLCSSLDRRLGLLAGKRSRLELITFVGDRKGHDRRYAIDAEKIKRELGWEPETGLAEGMEKTIDWYLENQDWLNQVRDGSYRKYYDEMYQQR
ncbi:MAG: dTDP-glucose 4,6-dehydratase [Deltaproteobacteria bacterium]|nr:dTDP-glucose 4,6-dehydratase [Deltaproteobacteria bacterium]